MQGRALAVDKAASPERFEVLHRRQILVIVYSSLRVLPTFRETDHAYTWAQPRPIYGKFQDRCFHSFNKNWVMGPLPTLLHPTVLSPSKNIGNEKEAHAITQK